MRAVRPLVCVVEDDKSISESLPDLLNEFGYSLDRRPPSWTLEEAAKSRQGKVATLACAGGLRSTSRFPVCGPETLGSQIGDGIARRLCEQQ